MTSYTQQLFGETYVVLPVPCNATGDLDKEECGKLAEKCLGLPPASKVALRLPSFNKDVPTYTASLLRGMPGMSPTAKSSKIADYVKTLFNYGADGETDIGHFSLPIGFLNVSLPLPGGQPRCNLRTNLYGELKWLNTLHVKPLAPDFGRPAEEPKEDQPKGEPTAEQRSAMVFGSRFYLAKASAGVNSRNRVAALLTKLATATGKLPEEDYEGMDLGLPSLVELMHVLGLPDIEFAIDPRKTKPWSVDRAWLVYRTIKYKLVDVDLKLLLVRNELSPPVAPEGQPEGQPTKLSPIGFTYTMIPKPTEGASGGVVAVHERRSDEGYVIDPRILSNPAVELFGVNDSRLSHVFHALRTFFYTFNFKVLESDFAIKASSKAGSPMASQQGPMVAGGPASAGQPGPAIEMAKPRGAKRYYQNGESPKTEPAKEHPKTEPAESTIGPNGGSTGRGSPDGSAMSYRGRGTRGGRSRP